MCKNNNTFYNMLSIGAIFRHYRSLCEIKYVAKTIPKSSRRRNNTKSQDLHTKGIKGLTFTKGVN